MCRLLAYVGPEILISHVVTWPSRSIIKVSIISILKTYLYPIATYH